MEIVAPTGLLRWDGVLTCVGRSESLEIGDKPYRADPGRIALEGNFTALVEPAPDAPGLGLTLNGDARSLQIGSAKLDIPQERSLPRWTLIIETVAVVTCGTGVIVGAIHRKRRRASIDVLFRWSRSDIVPGPPSLGDLPSEQADLMARSNRLAHAAHEAADDRQWGEAAHLMGRARSILDRADLAYWHGRYLMMEGRLEEAITALEAASLGIDTGEPERLAAACIVRLILSRAGIAYIGDMARLDGIMALEETGTFYLIRAIERAKRRGLVDEISAFEEFRSILWTPDVTRAAGDARVRLG
jgi:hypothetical protein